MRELLFNHSYAGPFVRPDELEHLAPAVALAHRQLHEGSGAGSSFLGWLDLPAKFDRGELARLKEAAQRIQQQSQALIVIGIGGSYLGARAVISALSHSFYNVLRSEVRQWPQIFFAGQNISGKYLEDLLELVADLDISVNVISKSGTTTEPAIAFRLFRELLEKKYGAAGARERIYVTTDSSKGALRAMAEAEGYTSFVIPDDVGGRFSVLTPVGLLPIAAAGIDIEALLEGAAAARGWFSRPELSENGAYQYAALRSIFQRKGKSIEVLVNYEPSLHYFSEWWKQLFGESEGKDHKGIYPASVNFTTDLHSLGQFMQDGARSLFATTIWVETGAGLEVPHDPGDRDGLNYLAGRTLAEINRKAFQGTLLAHTDGGVPNLVVDVPELSPFYLGALIYFFEKACALSGYLLGVNPFDQPGVEMYKRNMFALLGKPGFEEARKQLEQRLK
ncbi:MAG: glucose-6-phosphate isomerase [Limnochordia bacterium]